ncbi:MAG: ATP synthase F1 subunit delta [Thermodesulfobacteriota bacterium]
MSKTAVARRYARALIEVGTEGKADEKFGDELKELVAVFSESPVLYRVLLNPMYKLEERVDMAGEVADRIKVSGEVKRFLAILVEGRKVKLIEEISKAYARMEDELTGRLRVTVESPFEMDKAARSAVAERLKAETKKEVILTCEKNPTLIGGLVVRVGNTIMDGSLRTQLERVKQKMLEGVA